MTLIKRDNIIGDKSTNNIGRQVSINSDGNIIAITASANEKISAINSDSNVFISGTSTNIEKCYI